MNSLIEKRGMVSLEPNTSYLYSGVRLLCGAIFPFHSIRDWLIRKQNPLSFFIGLLFSRERVLQPTTTYQPLSPEREGCNYRSVSVASVGLLDGPLTRYAYSLSFLHLRSLPACYHARWKSPTFN